MSDIHSMTTQRLRTLVGETETALSQLKTELERREEQEQHHDIEQLEEHMKDAELSLQSIRDFIAYLISDMGRNKS